MSFTKILYELLIPKKITFNPLTDIPKVIKFINELFEGKYIEVIEKQEIEKFYILSKEIDAKAELLPLVRNVINDKKKGDEIKDSLLQHARLVHSLFYNKAHVLKQVSLIIDELEYNVRIEEEKKKTLRVISPQYGLEKR